MSASHRGDGLGEGLVCASMRRTVAARLVQWPSRWPFIGPPRGPTMRSLQTSGSPPPRVPPASPPATVFTPSLATPLVPASDSSPFGPTLPLFADFLPPLT